MDRARLLRGSSPPARRPPKWPGVIEAYRPFLPVSSQTPVVTLLEGGTPLVEAPALSKRLGGRLRVWLKVEGMNPTGSFKDRGMTVAMSKAAEGGAAWAICASTGNTSASAAAYAARAGIRCAVVVPEEGVSLGKLSQALMHGARVLPIRGGFDQALAIVRQVCERYPVTLVNSLNPHRIEGQATGAYEICDALGKAPDYHFIPVGNAGNITAYWLGYRRYREAGRIATTPRMLGFEAAGAAPIVRGRRVAKPRTVASAIRIGNPASWKGAEAAAKESRGGVWSVSDREILGAYNFLSRQEGVFAEAASAASVAGLLKLFRQGYFDGKKGGDIVCVLTGHGLKDPSLAMEQIEQPQAVASDVETVASALGLR